MGRIEWEVEELACIVCGKNGDEADEALNNDDAERLIYEKYGIDLNVYVEIIKDLLPFTPMVQSESKKEIYHAFVVEDNGLNRMVVRLRVENDE